MSRQVLTSASARCLTCAANMAAKNAVAWAHNHVRKNPSHKVEMTQTHAVSNAAPEDATGDMFKEQKPWPL